jgi:hypothetical protein
VINQGSNFKSKFSILESFLKLRILLLFKVLLVQNPITFTLVILVELKVDNLIIEPLFEERHRDNFIFLGIGKYVDF